MDGTLTVQTPAFHQAHNELRYSAYSKAVGRPVSNELAQEYEALYQKHGSNSAAFVAAGMPHGYWMQYFNQLDQSRYYKPIADVYETLDKLRKMVPISLFTNATPSVIKKTLQAINVAPGWFVHTITGDDIASSKPALEGFYLMIEESDLPASQILYVGDRVDVDIAPANSVGVQSCLVYSKSDEADYSCSKLADLLTLV
jgi:putative hydrolase of the HAD superfamily